MAQMFWIIAQFPLVFRQNWIKYTKLFRFQALKWGTVHFSTLSELRDVDKNVQTFFSSFTLFVRVKLSKFYVEICTIFPSFFMQKYRLGDLDSIFRYLVIIILQVDPLTPPKGSKWEDAQLSFIGQFLNLSRKWFITVSKNISRNC